jgi:hypothetical protein
MIHPAFRLPLGSQDPISPAMVSLCERAIRVDYEAAAPWHVGNPAPAAGKNQPKGSGDVFLGLCPLSAKRPTKFTALERDRLLKRQGDLRCELEETRPLRLSRPI